jgi:AraC family transcriptional regulator of adaptative response/methylated-DNA-[protein]-cysteine methyltransferase
MIEPEQHLWEATLHRDSRLDGFFYYAVVTTGVYCRPSCPSRRPRRENVRFFREREEAERAGFRACLRCQPADPATRHPQAELVRRVCRRIEANLDGPFTLDALGRELGLSPFHLQRTFKSVAGISPRAYADACRLETLKAGLRRGEPVTRAMVDAGYGSSSRFYERTATQLGMAPTQYRSGGAGEAIRYGIAASPVGKLLIAATGKGICAIRLGDSRRDLEAALRQEFRAAHLQPDDGAIARWSALIVEHLGGQRPRLDLPLDIQATAFQRLVWEHLRTIPRGETESYAEVAAAIGRPKAARAVARACAANSVAIAIPCHRVIRQDGTAGSYRWGIARKQRILEMEKRQIEPQPAPPAD